MRVKNKTVAFHTLGCKLNFSETSAISRKMEKAGYLRIPFEENADVYFIHGCTVTGSADKKTRHLIKQTIRKAPQAIIIVAGCYAELRHNEISNIPGVDLILGTSEKYNVVDYIDKLEKGNIPMLHCSSKNEYPVFNSAYSGGDRTRSFLLYHP